MKTDFGGVTDSEVILRNWGFTTPEFSHADRQTGFRPAYGLSPTPYVPALRCALPLNYPTKTFSHLDQYLSMAFAQLTFRESLRDSEVCLRAHEAKLYHLGIRGHLARASAAALRGRCLRR